MNNKSKILALILFNLTCLLFVVIALMQLDDVSRHQSIGELSLEQVVDLGESNLSNSTSSIQIELMPPIIQGISKSGKDVIKIRLENH